MKKTIIITILLITICGLTSCQEAEENPKELKTIESDLSNRDVPTPIIPEENEK